MKNISEHTGILVIEERMQSSNNGTPRFRCWVDTGKGTGWLFCTAVDSSLAYSVQNYEGRRVTVQIGNHYGRATLHRIFGGSK